ncbi:MAG: hypothetical protein EBZ77_13510 [Chitinophagia bacterium]|nr:hypothetical protein [Chitinophagia bacterium]
MDCGLQEIERRFNQTKAGSAITRIVRMIITTAQMDLCQSGFASAFAYTVLSTKTNEIGAQLTPGDVWSLEGDAFARAVLGILCEARAGRWDRTPLSYHQIGPKNNALTYAPVYATGACTTDPRLTSLVSSINQVLNDAKWLIDDCSDDGKARRIRSWRQAIMDRITPSTRQCEAHLSAMMNNMIGAKQSSLILTNTEALDAIRKEIATMLCSGAAGDLDALQFADQVAKVLVNGICELKGVFGQSGNALPSVNVNFGIARQSAVGNARPVVSAGI